MLYIILKIFEVKEIIIYTTVMILEKFELEIQDGRNEALNASDFRYRSMYCTV